MEETHKLILGNFLCCNFGEKCLPHLIPGGSESLRSSLCEVSSCINMRLPPIHSHVVIGGHCTKHCTWLHAVLSVTRTGVFNQVRQALQVNQAVPSTVQLALVQKRQTCPLYCISNYFILLASFGSFATRSYAVVIKVFVVSLRKRFQPGGQENPGKQLYGVPYKQRKQENACITVVAKGSANKSDSQRQLIKSI